MFTRGYLPFFLTSLHQLQWSNQSPGTAPRRAEPCAVALAGQAHGQLFGAALAPRGETGMGSRVTMKKWWILLGFCWIDMGCWWIDMDFMIALDQYWDFTDDLYWFIGLWLGKYAFSVGELLLYWNTTPPCFVPCYSAAMASTAWWSCIWSPRCSLGWSYWWWKGHRPVRLWHAGAAPLTLQAGQASNWRHFGAVANFVSTLLINRHLPVVPHKAVAEVSKIGNL